jgi:hypothetical protein
MGTTELENGVASEQVARAHSPNNKPVQGRKGMLAEHAEKVADSFNKVIEAVEAVGSSQEKLASEAQAKADELQETNREQAQEIAA